ncbi:hypothetical protein DPMN_163008 [Dreissena polymorpha]|uniref:Uncharacterized protein n=1 Tax=Dreissena polymorpha TaxID=45954 RepID=A0A9D4EVT0_DREPO|nr:hypothetical protein DPMN_163008 [Dreissena polymorpha]
MKVYDPTSEYEENDIEKLYEELEHTKVKIPKRCPRRIEPMRKRKTGLDFMTDVSTLTKR